MRTLKIIIAFIMVIALLLIFALPYGMGVWLQTEYPKRLNQLAHTSGATIHIQHYQRGWFTSKATFDIAIPVTKNSAKKQQFVVNATIHHGLFIIAKQPNGKNRFYLARAVLNAQAMEPNLTFTTSLIWKPNNQLQGHFHLKHLRLGDASHYILINGLNGTFNYQSEPDVIKMRFGINNGVFNKTASNDKTRINPFLQFTHLQSYADFTKKGPLWYGERKLHVKKIMLQTPTGETIVFNGARADAKQTQKDAVTNLHVTYSTKSVESRLLNIQSIAIEFSINQLDSKALAQLVNRALSLQSEQPSSIQSIVKLYQPFITLVNKGISINLQKFMLSTKTGAITAEGTLTIPPNPASPSLMHIANKTQGQARIKIPQAWLLNQLEHFYAKKALHDKRLKITPHDIAKQQISYWKRNKKITASKNYFISRFEYKNSGLLINGKPWNYEINPETETPSHGGIEEGAKE